MRLPLFCIFAIRDFDYSHWIFKEPYTAIMDLIFMVLHFTFKTIWNLIPTIFLFIIKMSGISFKKVIFRISTTIWFKVYKIQSYIKVDNGCGCFNIEDKTLYDTEVQYISLFSVGCSTKTATFCLWRKNWKKNFSFPEQKFEKNPVFSKANEN